MTARRARTEGSAFGRGGVTAAVLALVLSIVAPLVHAFAHPDHTLSDPWSVTDAAGAQGDSHADTGKNAPAPPRHHDCIVCQTLAASAMPTPAALVFRAIEATATAHLNPPRAEPAALSRHWRPPGRAPPHLS